MGTSGQPVVVIRSSAVRCCRFAVVWTADFPICPPACHAIAASTVRKDGKICRALGGGNAAELNTKRQANRCCRTTPDSSRRDRHSFQAIPKVPESESAVEVATAHEGLIPAIVDHVRDRQLLAHFVGNIQGAAKHIDRTLRSEAPVLPSSADGEQGKTQRRNAADIGGPARGAPRRGRSTRARACCVQSLMNLRAPSAVATAPPSTRPVPDDVSAVSSSPLPASATRFILVGFASSTEHGAAGAHPPNAQLGVLRNGKLRSPATARSQRLLPAFNNRIGGERRHRATGPKRGLSCEDRITGMRHHSFPFDFAVGHRHVPGDIVFIAG